MFYFQDYGKHFTLEDALYKSPEIYSGTVTHESLQYWGDKISAISQADLDNLVELLPRQCIDRIYAKSVIDALIERKKWLVPFLKLQREPFLSLSRDY